MLKNRRYLLGLGTGLIVGALLLQIMNLGVVTTPPIPSDNQQALPADWKTMAVQQGYEVMTTQEKNELLSKAAAKMEASSKFSIYIAQGMNSTDVANLLVKVGAVKNAAEFQKKLDESGLTKKIQVGVHSFSSNMSIQDIIRLLTNS